MSIYNIDNLKRRGKVTYCPNKNMLAVFFTTLTGHDISKHAWLNT